VDLTLALVNKAKSLHPKKIFEVQFMDHYVILCKNLNSVSCKIL